MNPLILRIKNWAATRSDIRSVHVAQPPAEPVPAFGTCCVLEVLIYRPVKNVLPDDAGWLESIAEVWAWQPDLDMDGAGCLRVLFAGGILSVFHFVGTREALENRLQQAPYRMLADRSAGLSDLPADSRLLPPVSFLPDEKIFRELVIEFYACAACTANLVRMNNLWAARFKEWTMRRHLLQMLAWRTAAVYGELPGPPQGHEDLAEMRLSVHSGQGADEMWSRLFVQMDLFGLAAKETAQLLALQELRGLDRRVFDYVRAQVRADSGAR